MPSEVTPQAPSPPGQRRPPAIELVGISKSFGPVQANRDIALRVEAGTIHGVIGENGAGKSTLMKVLSGIVRPTSGEIILDGAPVTFSSAADAASQGISIIHQELSLAPNMNVRDNIFMGREIRTAKGVDFAEEERQTRILMEELEEDIDPLTPVEDLRLGQQQIVEIARALSVNSRILIMDEPTSALSASEVEVLFKVIADLKSRGVSIVYISHHLEEALQITDHAVVLRDGTMTAFGERKDIDLEWIVRNMVGDNFDLGSPPTGYEFGDVKLSLRDLCVEDASGTGRLAVDHLSLDLRAGEIVCIYGLMGAGRTEMLECIAGRSRSVGGQILLNGEDVSHLSIAQRIEAGLVLVPEDRQRDGLVQTMTVGRNLSLASIPSFTRRIFTSRKAERGIVEGAIDDVRVFHEALSKPQLERLAQSGGRPEAPVPADGAAGSATMAQLAWTPDPNAVGHAVYLGTDYWTVALADPNESWSSGPASTTTPPPNSCSASAVARISPSLGQLVSLAALSSIATSLRWVKFTQLVKAAMSEPSRPAPPASASRLPTHTWSTEASRSASAPGPGERTVTE